MLVLLTLLLLRRISPTVATTPVRLCVCVCMCVSRAQESLIELIDARLEEKLAPLRERIEEIVARLEDSLSVQKELLDERDRRDAAARAAADEAAAAAAAAAALEAERSRAASIPAGMSRRHCVCHSACALVLLS